MCGEGVLVGAVQCNLVPEVGVCECAVGGMCQYTDNVEKRH